MDRTHVNRILTELRQVGRDDFRCEVKRARGGMPESLHETLSAFANADGGTVLLGVDEKTNFSVTGLLDAPRTADQFTTLCRPMEPPLAPAVNIVDLDGRSVLLAQVPAVPRDRRPCHLGSKAPWDSSFVRMADGDRKLTAYEVQLLLENRTTARHDSQIVDEARYSDLDRATLERFLVRVREQRAVLANRSDDEILHLMNIGRFTADVFHPTLAGLLAFGSFPQQFFPQLNVTVVVFPGTDASSPGPRGERFLDNRSVDGSIPVMVRETIAILKRHMKQRSIISGFVRIDEWEYPEEVLRESIVNALVHRDYSQWAQGAQVQVELYPDRLLIRNPGGVYGPLDVSQLGLGTVPAASRNPVLLKLLEDTPLELDRTVCENRGSGIVRIRAKLSEAGMEPPTFDDSIASFIAIFPNHALLDEETREWLSRLDVSLLHRSQLTALALARRGVTLTNTGYRAATGVTDSRTATAHLRELKERGFLSQEGNRGQTTYKLASAVSGQNLNDSTASSASHPERVLQVLSDIPVRRADIARATGLTNEQVGTALQRLRVQGRVQIVGQPRSKSAAWRRSPG